MKQKLLAYKMTKDKTIQEQLEDFSKITDDLENIDVKITDEDKAIMLLNSLPKSFDNLKDAMLYEKPDITYAEVKSSVKTKDLHLRMDKDSNTTGESLMVHGR